MTRDEALEAYRDATARVVPWPLDAPFPEQDLWAYIWKKYSAEEVEEISKWTRGRFYPGVSTRCEVIIDPDFRAAYDAWLSEIRKRGEAQDARNRKYRERVHAVYWGAVAAAVVWSLLSW